ncbi:MAG: hypothetical protein NTV43_07345 [Methylococcales bacterium]|nr:hypothetical protein [Methylococcales bacterium]
MQTLQISDQTAQQFNDTAAQEHISGSDLIERLVKKYSQELTKQRELKAFFSPYQKDMTGFKFDRDEANAR